MNGTLAIPINDADHVRGAADAPLTLVEYGDYQCPACGMAFPFVERILDRHGRQLRFVFRHFPLSQVHPLAAMAAQVAEGAGIFGKFWEMHDWLYAYQPTWSRAGASAVADGIEAIGLDPRALEPVLDDPAITERVRRDFMGGVRSGVNGTPSFFIDGQLYHGGVDTLGAAIASHLASR